MEIEWEERLGLIGILGFRSIRSIGFLRRGRLLLIWYVFRYTMGDQTLTNVVFIGICSRKLVSGTVRPFHTSEKIRIHIWW